MGDVTHLQHSHAASGILGIAGIVLALWSASNCGAAFMRASNIIYDLPEGRPARTTAPIRLGVTLVTMILLVAASVIVVVTGGLAQKAGNVLGLGQAAVTIWDIAKWPVLLIIIGLILAILFWASPNARHGFQWVSPGGFIAVVLLLAASALFAAYVANFSHYANSSHYNKSYGSLAGVIFLIWVWISNVAILLGAEFNAELERGRAVAAGHPAGQEPFSAAGRPQAAEGREAAAELKGKLIRAAGRVRGAADSRAWGLMPGTGCGIALLRERQAMPALRGGRRALRGMFVVARRAPPVRGQGLVHLIA
jgi:membrane protein